MGISAGSPAGQLMKQALEEQERVSQQNSRPLNSESFSEETENRLREELKDRAAYTDPALHQPPTILQQQIHLTMDFGPVLREMASRIDLVSNRIEGPVLPTGGVEPPEPDVGGTELPLVDVLCRAVNHAQAGLEDLNRAVARIEDIIGR